jgi:ABC-type transport system substrate-binding protein
MDRTSASFVSRRWVSALAATSLIALSLVLAPPALSEGVPESVGPNVYRTAVNDLGLSSDLDPTSEYSAPGFSLLSQMLVRTLVTFRHVAGAAGDEVVPDLATDLGTVSDGGKTYTFTLKDGVMFGPPLNRPITSSDIAYAFERAASNWFWGGVQLLLRRDDRGVHDARRSAGANLRDRNTEPADDCVPPDRADGRLPSPAGDAGRRPDPREGRRVLR